MLTNMENENDQIAERAGVFQSGATPLSESNLPMHIPRQPTLPVESSEQVRAAAWTLSEILSQEKLITTLDIGDKEGEVWNFRVTPEKVFETHFRSFSDVFRLYSWTLHFRIQFRSNFQQVGQIIVGQNNIPGETMWFLMGGDDAMGRFKRSYKMLTMLPHTKVPMGEDTDVHVEFQWNLPVPAAYGPKSYHHTFLPIEQTQFYRERWDMGEVYVVVPWKMEMAQGVNPSLSMRVWSRLSNVTMGAYDVRDNVL